MLAAQVRTVECCSVPAHARALESAATAGAARVSGAADAVSRLDGDESMVLCRYALRRAALSAASPFGGGAGGSPEPMPGGARGAAEGVGRASPRRPGRPAWTPTEWAWVVVPAGARRCGDLALQAVRGAGVGGWGGLMSSCVRLCPRTCCTGVLRCRNSSGVHRKYRVASVVFRWHFRGDPHGCGGAARSCALKYGARGAAVVCVCARARDVRVSRRAGVRCTARVWAARRRPSRICCSRDAPWRSARARARARCTTRPCATAAKSWSAFSRRALMCTRRMRYASFKGEGEGVFTPRAAERVDAAALRVRGVSGRRRGAASRARSGGECEG